MIDNPVQQALADARLRDQIAAWERNEAAVAQRLSGSLVGDVCAASGEPTDTAALGSFTDWCARAGVRCCPAAPACVAQFVLDRAALGVDTIGHAVAAIAAMHLQLGLANPVATPVVGAALARVGKLDPPRAWPKWLKARFAELPCDLQCAIADHERARERALRRTQNEAAAMRRELKQLKEITA